MYYILFISKNISSTYSEHISTHLQQNPYNICVLLFNKLGVMQFDLFFQYVSAFAFLPFNYLLKCIYIYIVSISIIVVLHELEIESENALSPKKLLLIYSQISLYPPEISTLRTMSFEDLYIQLVTTSTNCTLLQVISSTIRDVLFSPNLVQDIISRPYEIEQRENYKESHNGQLKYICCLCIKLELKKYRHFDFESFPNARDIKFKKFLGIANGINQCKSLFSLQSPSVFKNNRIFKRTKPKEPTLRPSKVLSFNSSATGNNSSNKESNRGLSEYESGSMYLSHLRQSRRCLSKNRDST